VLAADGLRKGFRGVPAVRGVSFAVAAGEMLALIGPNGAGKSTCFNMLNGQLRPDAGRIALLGRDIAGLAPRRVCRLGVGRTFQITATFASMSVRENVQTALLSSAKRSFVFWGSASGAQIGRADELLDLVGMKAEARRPVAQLAYGDLKRLELAIALANDPRLLLMDEPTAGMAPKERVELMRFVAQIVRERGIGVLFTEHDMDVVFEHADRVMVLSRGELIAEGPPSEVRHNRGVQAIYLGGGRVYDISHQEPTP